MSRSRKGNRTEEEGSSWLNEPAAAADGIQALPPRRKVYPSNKMKLEKLFFHTLISLFILVLAGLIYWGSGMIHS